ncbi:hypothetical protein OXIME_000675 [Oxyplasma meridianum]|uniref:ABC transporter permease n=1 Tax=Oxyplasma meridianum TaxID=3073602 RepID=A0AAX4NF86_9ARCH
MLLKTIKLILITRYSRAFILILLFLLAYNIFIGLVIKPAEIVYYRYVVLAIFSFFTLLAGVNSTVPLLKSDVHFLFVSAMPKKDLILSLFTSKYVFYGLSSLIPVLYTLPYTQSGRIDEGLGLILSLLMTFFVTSIGLALYDFSIKVRVAVSVAITVWFIGPIFGFYYSPMAFLFGHFIYGTLFVVILSFCFTYFAFRTLAASQIEKTRVIGSAKVKRDESGNVIIKIPKESSFRNRSVAFNTIAFNFSRVPIYSRTSFISRSRSGTTKISRVIIVGIAISILLNFILVKFSTTGSTRLLISVFISVYSVMFIPILFSQSALSLERAWLSFTSMDPGVYMKYFMTGKILQAISFTAPISAGLIFISLFYGLPYLGLALLELVPIPCLLVVYIYIGFSVGVFQIRDPEFVTQQFNSKQFFNALPSILFLPIAAISVIIPYFGVIFALVMVAFALISITRTKLWRKKAFRLIESGFV